MAVSPVSEARLQTVHPNLSYRVSQLAAILGFDLEVSRAFATWAEQDALYEIGRSLPGKIVTDAKGGYSAHNFGYAVDVFPEDIEPGQPDWDLSHPAWKKILALAPSRGLAEGAQWCKFKDSPHLYLDELPPSPTDAMRQQFLNGGLINVWNNFPKLIDS
jgi:peptidoglycan L-alanyl-D-glutamate endopeptidase CwlK